MFISVWKAGASGPLYFEDIGSGFHFAVMRKAIHDSLENKKQYARRFPVLLKTPLSYVDFSPKLAEELQKEILTIIKEKESLCIVPQYSYSIRTVASIIRKLKTILRGCEIAIENNGILGWFPDFVDKHKARIMLEETQKHLKSKGIYIDITAIPLNDKKTFKLISSGKTSGVYLLEDKGIRKFFKEISSDRFDDMVAVIAIYSIGLLGSGMMEDFIKRKDQKVPIKYMYPQFKKILDETYGLILYHEQITEILKVIGGFSVEKAEIVRRSMRKSDTGKVSEFKDEFIKGAINNGLTKRDAERTFDLINYFAGYSLSKSFAAKHATYAYQTAYLKAHYPREFMEAVNVFKKMLYTYKKSWISGDL